jgi:autophagy-related protein 2
MRYVHHYTCQHDFPATRDLTQTINSNLSALPLRLHDGSILSVTARIPWPNPLTSALGLSLQSPRFTFHLVPSCSSTPAHGENLADSVTSLAESFIRDELTSQMEGALRESFLPNRNPASTSDVRNVPGSIDPFLSDPEADSDPDGVSIFAALIEALLARFVFDAVDTKITLVDPENTIFTISIPEIRYSTEGGEPAQPGNQPQGAIPRQLGQTRTVSISGVSISARSLQAVVSSPSTLSPAATFSHLRVHPHGHSSYRSHPDWHSPTSSQSSLDADTECLMSQSLVSLPPKPLSPVHSVESSMYQSAMDTSMYRSAMSMTGSVSTMPDDKAGRGMNQNSSELLSPASGHKEDSPLHVPDSDSQASSRTSELRGLEGGEETIISFGADPIVIRLTTPPLAVHPASDSPFASKQPPHQGADSRPVAPDGLQLSLSIGLIGCVFRPSHIRSILHVVRMFDLPGSSTSPTTATQSLPISALGLKASAKIRGFVVLLFPSSSNASEHSSEAIASYFSRPVVPPHLPHGYVRLHLESIEAVSSFDTAIPLTDQTTPIKASKVPTLADRDTAITGSLSLKDLSIFAFYVYSSDAGSATLAASPILVTDQHLVTQYSRTYSHPNPNDAKLEHRRLPEFDVINWTDEAHRTNSVKVSKWRTKLKHERLSAEVVSAIRMEVKTDFATDGDKSGIGVVVYVIPLHVFLDLRLALNVDDGLVPFIVEVMGGLPGGESSPEIVKGTDGDLFGDNEKMGHGQPAVPYARVSESEQGPGKKGGSAEKLVLQDSDLDSRAEAPRKATMSLGEFKTKRRSGKVNVELCYIFF